jgi:inorganic phosphate transporter, PiT family
MLLAQIDWIRAGLVVIALLYALLNGYNDAGAIIVGMLAGRSLHPRQALVLAAVGELAGPFLLGVGVAATIATGIVDPTAVDVAVLAGAMAGAILWGFGASTLGIPTSASHALVGGMVGAALAAKGLAVMQVAGVVRVLIFLVMAPLLGLAAGYLVTKLMIYYLAQSGAGPDVVRGLRRWTIVSCLAFAVGHGANNAQKSMGLIALSLLILGDARTFEVPLWATAASAMFMAAGVAIGGQKVIRTLLTQFYTLRTLHGLSASVSGTAILLAATFMGLPISATQVSSMAVAGAGAGERVSKVRWDVVTDILTTWVVTIPGAGLLSAGIYLLLRLV